MPDQPWSLRRRVRIGVIQILVGAALMAASAWLQPMLTGSFAFLVGVAGALGFLVVIAGLVMIARRPAPEGESKEK